MKVGEFVENKKEWCKKLLAKTGYVSAQKSHANYLSRHGLEQGPSLCFQISRKIQDRVKGGGGGGGGEGGGAEKSC